MTEELKIIMDALVQMGEVGRDAFIWWLIFNYGLKYLTMIFMIGMSAYCIVLLVRNIDDNTKTVADLMKLLGIGDREKLYRAIKDMRDKE